MAAVIRSTQELPSLDEDETDTSTRNVNLRTSAGLPKALTTHDVPFASTRREALSSIVNPGTFAAGSAVLARAGQIVSVISFFVVVTSVSIFCIETLPAYHENPSRVLLWIEVGCIVFFTVELVVRIAAYPTVWKFFTVLMNWVDIFAVLPFYLELVLQAIQGESTFDFTKFIILRVFRLIRVLRVLKLSRHNDGMRDIGETLKQSTDALSLAAFLLVTATILFSSALYFAEAAICELSPEDNMLRYADGKLSDFQSVPATFWWCIVTLTTVGYGNEVPRSHIGKVIASLAMGCGILVIAFPTMILGFNFQLVREHRHRQRMVKSRMESRFRKGKAGEGSNPSADQTRVVSNVLSAFSKRERNNPVIVATQPSAKSQPHDREEQPDGREGEGGCLERGFIPGEVCMASTVGSDSLAEGEAEMLDVQGKKRGACRVEDCDCDKFMRCPMTGHAHCQFCLHAPIQHARLTPEVNFSPTRVRANFHNDLSSRSLRPKMDSVRSNAPSCPPSVPATASSNPPTHASASTHSLRPPFSSGHSLRPTHPASFTSHPGASATLSPPNNGAPPALTSDYLAPSDHSSTSHNPTSPTKEKSGRGADELGG